jgi:uncharacterized membrane protein
MTHWFSARGRFGWLLLASLCLNAALGTYVSVQWLRPDLPPVVSSALPQRIMERAAGRLPPDDAEILWRIYRSKQPEMLPLQADFLRALARTMRVLGEQDLDQDALRAAVRDARESRLKIGDAMIDVFVEALTQISAKGRRQLVGTFRR